jgi:hypothetical protein
MSGFRMPTNCVVGPGESFLKPGELAIRVNACMKCGKGLGKGLDILLDSFENGYVGIDANGATGQDIAHDIKFGALCKKHEHLAQYRWKGNEVTRL